MRFIVIKRNFLPQTARQRRVRDRYDSLTMHIKKYNTSTVIIEAMEVGLIAANREGGNSTT
jgi:hypothetical protein